jgi:hypothetical protein
VSEPKPIDRAFFRETGEGTLFFPWGLGHRGYRLADERGRARASRAAGLLLGGTVAVGTWAAAVLQPVMESESAGAAEALRALAAPLAGLALVIGLYALWVWRFVEDLSESDLRISRDERLREAATVAPPWKVATIGGVTCVMGATVFWIEPHQVWLGGLAVALGLAMVAWSRVLKRASG